MRGGVGGAGPAARRTEAAARARKGDDAIKPAAVAVHAHEVARKDPAAQEGAQLAQDEGRQRRQAPGSKLDRARALGVRVLEETAFAQLVGR